MTRTIDLAAGHRPTGAPPAVTTGRVERQLELDALRGIAALMVLLVHASQMVPPLALHHIPGMGLLHWLLFEHTPLRVLIDGRSAVLFFFVLSGYVLTRALLVSGSPGLLVFAVQRSIRLMLPVGASVLLSVALYFLVFDPALLPRLRHRTLDTWLVPPTFAQVIGNALLLSTAEELRLNIPLWSLAHEWRLTLFLPLVLVFRGRALLLLVVVFSIMLFGQILGAGENLTQLGLDAIGSIASTLYFALGIGAGVVLAMAGPLPKPDGPQRVLLLTLAATLFSMKSDLAIYLGAAILVVVAQEPGGFRRLLRHRVTAWLGHISFSLYLVHVPILVATLYAVDRWASPIAAAVIGGILALATAALMRAAVEEPSRRLARRVARRMARRRGGASPVAS